VSARQTPRVSAFRVMYVSNLDGAHIPFADFNRRELPEALRCVRSMAHQYALNSEWILKRERKTIARFPRRAKVTGDAS